jgi:hypothetical protein
MCFSASASFGAGVVLTVIGVVSLKQAKTPSQIPFSSIPLIFAVQQITEGFLWVALSNSFNSTLQSITTYLFLFLAQVVWPTLIPFSVMMVEKDKKRKKNLLIFVGIGIIVSAYLFYCLLNYNIHASIIEYHIFYKQDYPLFLRLYGGALYLMATIVPHFISSVKKMGILGCSILISYIVSTIFYHNYVLSVWCFFASIIAIEIYIIMKGIKNPANDILAVNLK